MAKGFRGVLIGFSLYSVFCLALFLMAKPISGANSAKTEPQKTESPQTTEIPAQKADDYKSRINWDIDTDTTLTAAEKKMFKAATLKVLKDEPNCKSIDFGMKSTNQKGQYFVTCQPNNDGSVFNVFFSAKDLQDGKSISIPEPYPETPSQEACIDAIKARVLHPSTLEIHRFLGYASSVANNGNRLISQEFTAQNGFGAKTRYEARCLVEPNGDLDISIKESGS